MSTPLPLLVEAMRAVETAAKATRSDSPGGKRVTKKETAQLVRHAGQMLIAVADLLEGG